MDLIKCDLSQTLEQLKSIYLMSLNLHEFHKKNYFNFIAVKDFCNPNKLIEQFIVEIDRNLNGI